MDVSFLIISFVFLLMMYIHSGFPPILHNLRVFYVCRYQIGLSPTFYTLNQNPSPPHSKLAEGGFINYL